MNFVNRVLLDDSSIVSYVGSVIVTRRIVDIAVAIRENRWNSLRRRSDGCRKSMIISVYLVEDLIVRYVVPSKNVSPLVCR